MPLWEIGELCGTSATSPILLAPSSDLRTFCKTSSPLLALASIIFPSLNVTLMFSINVP